MANHRNHLTVFDLPHGNWVGLADAANQLGVKRSRLWRIISDHGITRHRAKAFDSRPDVNGKRRATYATFVDATDLRWAIVARQRDTNITQQPQRNDTPCLY